MGIRAIGGMVVAASLIAGPASADREVVLEKTKLRVTIPDGWTLDTAAFTNMDLFVRDGRQLGGLQLEAGTCDAFLTRSREGRANVALEDRVEVAPRWAGHSYQFGETPYVAICRDLVIEGVAAAAIIEAEVGEAAGLVAVLDPAIDRSLAAEARPEPGPRPSPRPSPRPAARRAGRDAMTLGRAYSEAFALHLEGADDFAGGGSLGVERTFDLLPNRYVAVLVGPGWALGFDNAGHFRVDGHIGLGVGVHLGAGDLAALVTAGGERRGPDGFEGYVGGQVLARIPVSGRTWLDASVQRDSNAYRAWFQVIGRSALPLGYGLEWIHHGDRLGAGDDVVGVFAGFGWP